MKIVVDVTPLVRPVPLGVLRAARGLVTALEERGRLTVERCAPPSGAALGPWRQMALRRHAARSQADGILTLVSSFPLATRRPVVPTVHEMPWLLGEGENAGPRHRAWAAIARRRATRVLTPSQVVADALGPIARRVPWGLDRAFLEEANRPASEPIVLLPGGGRAKKRPELVAAALSRANEPWRALVTGRDAPTASHPRLEHLGEVDDARLAELYRSSLGTVLLARSEGFAFPLLESLACARPVIVPEGAPWIGLANGHATPLDVEDADLLAQTIDDWCRSRRSIDEAAVDHARSFTWERAAAAVEALWEEIA